VAFKLTIVSKQYALALFAVWCYCVKQTTPEEANIMPRRDRGDIRVEKLAGKHGIPEEAIRRPDGKKRRKDTKLETLRKEHAK